MADSTRRVIYVALTGNILIALTKLAAGVFTHSAAMLAEGIHSAVDTSNQGLLLYGLRRAHKPPDREFPFGYGKEIYFWSFVVAIQVFTIGAGAAMVRGIGQIMHPEPIRNIAVNYIVILVSFLFEGVSWWFAMSDFSRTKGKRSYLQAVQHGKDPSRFMVVFEDSAALLGLFIAGSGLILQQLTGVVIVDGVASILIALLLGATAVWLAYETKGLLIGESANQEVVNGIRSLIANHQEVGRVNEVLTMHIGPEYILVNLCMELRPGLSVMGEQRVVSRLQRAIKRQFPAVRRVFFEISQSQ